MGVAYSQIFPPAPTLTEKNLPSQKGRVFIVTGGYSGIGQQLAGILYHAGGIVYIAGRSREKSDTAIAEIKAKDDTANTVDGKLEFLDVDLSDLRTIKPAAEAFKAKESRLDVLFNNAGAGLTPVHIKSAQGYEMCVATNVLGPFLLTLCLLPSLQAAAQTRSPGSVRVVWSSSQVVDGAPTGGFEMKDITDAAALGMNPRYTNSKTANWFLASEFAKRIGDEEGILSLTQNPGALKTNILRNAPRLLYWVAFPLLSDAIYGAYTELYCGLSNDLTLEKDSGCYVLPWGRVHPSPRTDLLNAMKSKEDGGTGRAEELWNWCEERVAEFN